MDHHRTSRSHHSAKVKKRIVLSGSYIAEISKPCEVLIKNIILQSYIDTNPKHKNLLIPNIDYSLYANNNTNNNLNIKEINLSAIDLEDTNGLQLLLKMQKERLNNLDNVPIHFNSISVYTVILYLVLCFIVIYLFYYYCRVKCCIAKLSVKDVNSLENSPNSEVFSKGGGVIELITKN